MTMEKATISNMLHDYGFALMAKHALHEQNHQVLAGYVILLYREAKKRNDWHAVERLWSHYLIN